MKFIRFLMSAVLATSFLFFHLANAATPVETHGALSVKGNRIVDASGKAVSFAGPSLFWSNTGWKADRFYNADVVKSVKQNWNAEIIRAAIGAGKNGGYLTDPANNFARAVTVIDAAIAEGIYVLVDWHSHDAEKHPEVAIEFFTKIATRYADKPNVIYEIYNEPLNNTDWSTQIKPYAEKVIAAIRKIDKDNLIIVGTQTWSQDVDKAAEDPIKNVNNLAYTLHFYAGTHKQELRDKAKKALEKGIALMVTEWGTVNANGDGAVDKEETQRWLDFMREHQLTHCNWALNDKKEGSSQLKPGTKSNGKWTDKDFTESGLYVRDIIRNW